MVLTVLPEHLRLSPTRLAFPELIIQKPKNQEPVSGFLASE